MRVWSHSENQIKKSIKAKLNEMGYPDWVYDDFNEVVTHGTITKKLDQALNQTKKQRINKHGVEHGLKVVWNALCLFELIHKGAIESDYVSQGILPDKTTVLLCLLFASYVHDIGRFFVRDIDHEMGIDKALRILEAQSAAGTGRILQKIATTHTAEILDRIKELCLCHDKKKSRSESVEIALIKLADSLDCDRNRAYEIDPLHKPSEKLAIFLQDDSPEKYFGCLSVEKVNIKYNEKEKEIEITLTINNFLASIPIETILNVIKKCEKGRNSAAQFANKIRLYVHYKEDNGDKFRIYPEQIPPGVTEEKVRETLEEEMSAKVKEFIKGGWIERAIHEAESAYFNNPSKSGLQLVSALLSSKRSRDWHRAWKVLQKMEEAPSLYYISLSYLLWSVDEIPQAIKVAEKGLKVAEKKEDQVGINKVKNSLAYYYADLGDPNYKNIARRYAEEALSASPENPAPMDTKGYVKIVYGKKIEEIKEGINLCEEARRRGAPLKLYIKHLSKATERLRSLE